MRAVTETQPKSRITGIELLNTSSLNHGTAFTSSERAALG